LNNGYHAVIESGESDPKWDDFLSRIDGGHHEQSTYWAKVKGHQGWHAVRIKVLNGSDWMAGAQMLCKKLPWGGSVGYISCGPFYKVPDDESLDVLIREINQVAKKRNIQYVVFTPYVANVYLDKVLIKNGYRPTFEQLPPTSPAWATLVLDLSKDFDSLLMDMRYEMRRKIKLASESGLTVREGDRKDLDDLFKLMSMVAERRGEKPVPGSVETFNNIWDYYNPEQRVNLLVVEFDGEPISMGIIFTFGNTVRSWKYGWSGKEAKKYPNHMLYWELIRWSKNNGFKYFDLVQVDPVIADHLTSGKPVTEELKSRRLYGPTQFKMGFGGNVVKFSGPWFRFQNPLIRFIYRHVGPSLMRTSLAKKMVAKLS
jgi:lipid II:glycine glycyltransferase (peptidoglycan interpeptide bridge formation enzyme)